GALTNARQQLAPLIFGNAEWTRCHTVAASHAARLVVDHGSGCGLPQGCNWTNRSAGRIETIHAQTPHEVLSAGKNCGVLAVRLFLFVGDGFRVRQLVLVGASLLARLAADANR